MIYKKHSVNQVYISHPELLPFSKTTFYKYIDLGILNVRNIDLKRKVRFKFKKEYDYSRNRIKPSIKINRFYSDFKDYLEYHPNASIVEMDTVIGTQGGKGGKCFLTLLFRQFNFMLIYLLPYKKSMYVTEIFNYLKNILGINEFKRLFEIILMVQNLMILKVLKLILILEKNFHLFFIAILIVLGKKVLLKKIMNIFAIFFLKVHPLLV